MNDAARERFASLLNAYPDDVYFPIIRTYLGQIQTPFSKRDLTQRLVVFFSKPSVQTHMTDLLDDEDLKILTAVKLFGPIDGSVLAGLFSTTATYPARVRHISLLIRRLWLVKEENNLSLNPLLEPLLEPLLSLSALFGKPSGKPSGNFTATIEVVKGYLSLAVGKRRTIDDETLQAAFPSCPVSIREQFFVRLSNALSKTGALVAGQIDYERSTHLFFLPWPVMIARFISADCGVPQASVLRLLSLLENLGSLRKDAFPLGCRLLHATGSETLPEDMLEILVQWGIVTEENGDLIVTPVPPENGVGPNLVIDSDRTASFSGSLPADDILWRFATLVKLDVRTVYQISQESFSRALDGGLSWEKVREYLRANGAKQTLVDELALEEERYREVELYHGIVIKADERIARLVEQITSLHDAILARLADGVYLMDSRTYPFWCKTLKESLGFLPSLQGEPYSSEETPEQRGEEPEQATSNPFGRLRRTLPSKKTKYDGTILSMVQDHGGNSVAREALEVRLRDKLLVDSSQIRSFVPDENPQAGGFDYQGKVALLRRSLTLKNALLLLQVGQEELLAQPLELTKATDGQMLLKATILPSGQVRIIPVGKIFLVRMGRTYIRL